MTTDEIEYAIECSVERKTDSIDRQFMAGKLDQQAYDKAMHELSAWADAQYKQAYAMFGHGDQS